MSIVRDVRPYRIHVEDSVLRDLRERIDRTRWPDAIDGAGWSYGTDPEYLHDLVSYWATDFDWPAQQHRMNDLAHYRADIDGLGVHFVHARGRGPDPLPIILTHGWPSTFLEYVDVIGALTDPTAHGGRPEDAFDVVIPSLPGYGFSDRPRQAGMLRTTIADMWTALMVDGLGYQRFGAHGTDIGAGVTAGIGRQHPDRIAGIHLTACSFPPPVGPLSSAEAAFLDANAAWDGVEGAYAEIQATKPQTLAYGLNDSPAGLAAWIVEKFRSWSDCNGDVTNRFTHDQLLRNLTIYWATGTINSSMRLYFEHRRTPPPFTPVGVPTGFAVFANEYIPWGRPPRSLAERSFDVVHWTEFDQGGHFAALEEPELLVRDIREFFRPLRRPI